MNLNWKVKSGLFRAAEALPPSLLYFAQRNLSRRARKKLNFARISDVWTFHDSNLPEGTARVIEFGAGKSLAQNLYLSRRGLSQDVVDLNRMLELHLVNAAIQQLVKLGIEIDPEPVRSLDDLRERHRITYRAPYDMRSTDYPDGSFDACVSTSTFEHIPPEDLKRILIELKRILRPGGLLSAHIDYSDHYEHTDRSITRLNFLRFGEEEWGRHNHSHHYQNRLRHGHYVKMFEELGFEFVIADAIDPPDSVPDDVRPELLFGDGNDFMLHGRFLLRA